MLECDTIVEVRRQTQYRGLFIHQINYLRERTRALEGFRINCKLFEYKYSQKLLELLSEDFESFYATLLSLVKD